MAAALGWLALAAGLVLLLDVAFVRSSRALFSGVPGAFLSFPQQLATLALALVPVSAFLGLLFQWSARTYVSTGHTLAAAYGIESLGGVAGGLLATLLPRWGVQNVSLAAACAAVAAVVRHQQGLRTRSADRWRLCPGHGSGCLRAVWPDRSRTHRLEPPKPRRHT